MVYPKEGRGIFHVEGHGEAMQTIFGVV